MGIERERLIRLSSDYESLKEQWRQAQVELKRLKAKREIKDED